MAKKPTKKPRGLNSKEKSEVKKIAKASVQATAEHKYMNTLQTFNTAPHISKSGARVSVLGFTNTVNKIGAGDSEQILNYGQSNPESVPLPTYAPMQELKMLRPFTDNTGDAQTDNYALEGRECMPRSAKCKWRLSRNISSQVAGFSQTAWDGNTGIPPNLATNLPIICRMIRVSPKLTQTNQVCNPEDDLFLSEFNNQTGINNSAFDDLELLTYRINRRRYTVIEDKFFRIQNGLTIQYTRAIKSSSGAGVSSTAVLQPMISNCNANCEKVLTTYHQLTSKKNTKVFYDQPESFGLENPSSGMRREYILYHFMYAGAESYLDNEVTAPKAPQDLRISAVPLVKFTDV